MKRKNTFKFKFKCHRCDNIFIEKLNRGDLYIKNSYSNKEWGWYCSKCKDKNKKILNKKQEFEFPKLTQSRFTAKTITAEQIRYAFFQKITEMKDLEQNEKERLFHLIRIKQNPSFWRENKYISIDEDSGKGLICKYYSDGLKYGFEIFYDNFINITLNLSEDEIKEWKELKLKIMKMMY